MDAIYFSKFSSGIFRPLVIQISLTNLSSNRCGDALHWWSRSLWFFRTVVFFTKILNNGAIVVSSIRYFSERTRKDISMEMSRWVNLHMIIIVIEYFCDLGSTGGGINISSYQSIFPVFWRNVARYVSYFSFLCVF